MRVLSVIAFCLAISPAMAAGPHPCAEDARKMAVKLLALHTEGHEISEVNIAEKVTRRAPLKALKGRGKFDVLEVMGYVYKAQYRMRFIYAQIDPPCLLMGQELIEIADPY